LEFSSFSGRVKKIYKNFNKNLDDSTGKFGKIFGNGGMA